MNRIAMLTWLEFVKNYGWPIAKAELPTEESPSTVLAL